MILGKRSAFDKALKGVKAYTLEASLYRCLNNGKCTTADGINTIKKAYR